MRRAVAVAGVAILSATTCLFATRTPVAASSTCTVWTDPAGDENPQTLPAIPGVQGGSSAALDLLQGTVTPDFGSDTLKVRVYVADMSLTVPNGATSMTWATGWSVNTAQEHVVYVRVDSGGAVSYYDFNSPDPDTGSYQLGAGGYVEVDVPFAHLGIQRGSVLPGLGTASSLQYTYVAQTGTGTSEGVDGSPMPGPDYVVGSC